VNAVKELSARALLIVDKAELGAFAAERPDEPMNQRENFALVLTVSQSAIGSMEFV
jgi:hypothetical protein